MRLTVLGGSGGYPGHGAPCSGYLVEADGYTLLVDPGYGVATALSRAVEPRFDAVAVSHGHPDHCADLNPILRARAWADIRQPPLPVYAPPGALDAVLALDRPEVIAGSYTLHELDDGDELTIGSLQVRTVILPHPRPNLGFRLSSGARSMAYTGDCGPSDALVELAAGVDLLLAEASYASRVPPELVGSLSSAADAGRQAAAAGVRQLVLTHLMPDTDEGEATTAAARSFQGPITVARPSLVLDI